MTVQEPQQDLNSPREECGVFGVWAPGEEVAKLTYYGLYALQHRGQEAAFRAALGTLGSRAFGKSGGRLLQATAFGLSHIADARATGEPVVATVLVTGVGGWLFGWLADRSGSLAAPMVVHLAINEAGAAAALIVQRRIGDPHRSSM